MRNNGHCSPDHYNSSDYQQTVRIERGYTNGLTPEEVYIREATFALRAAEYSDPDSFGQNDAILDLACGAAMHTYNMSDMLSHIVNIHACDPAEELGTIASSKLAQRISRGIHDRITFTFGEETMMQNLDRSSLGSYNYRLITVLGDSFDMSICDTKKALRNFHEILEPGGKVVMQFRQRDPKAPYKQQREQNSAIEARRKEIDLSNTR